MWALVFISGIAGIFGADSMHSFHEHSNHNRVFEFVWAVPCETGLKSSGYSVVPTGLLFLKQANRDGSVGKICSD